MIFRYIGECEFFQKNFNKGKDKILSKFRSNKREDREMFKYAKYVEEQNNSE